MALVFRSKSDERGDVAGTIRSAVHGAAERLERAGVDGARKEAWLLLAHVRRQDRAVLMAHADDALDTQDRRVFERLIGRRVVREPFAQIVGQKEFWSLEFRVTEHVLCPRPDSECLIEATLAQASERWPDQGRDVRILDLGTGSGCLLLTLLSELKEATGVGLDISFEALLIARANGERLGLAKRARWLCSNWDTALDGRFDLIVANPPYIAEHAKPALQPEVRDFEPAAALYAGKDGLDGYRTLAGRLRNLLTEDGVVFLEIGEGQAAAVECLLEQNDLRPLARRPDLAGIDRCLVAERRRSSTTL